MVNLSDFLSSKYSIYKYKFYLQKTHISQYLYWTCVLQERVQGLQWEHDDYNVRHCERGGGATDGHMSE